MLKKCRIEWLRRKTVCDEGSVSDAQKIVSDFYDKKNPLSNLSVKPLDERAASDAREGLSIRCTFCATVANIIGHPFEFRRDVVSVARVKQGLGGATAA